VRRALDLEVSMYFEVLDWPAMTERVEAFL
jgi:hypothetical protein